MQTCSNWRCASSALCLHFKPRALVWRRPPSAHLWRQPSHWHWLVAQLSKQTVTRGSRFLIEWFIELDVMSFHGQNSSFYESRSFAKHYIQVSPPNNYDSRHQVSSQNLESRRRSKRGHVSWWSFDVIKISERAFVHFYTRTVHRLLTNKKYMCMSELVHSRVISCEKFCWITLLDILLTSSCRHRLCTWTWRFTRLQILNAIWVLWRSSFGAKVVQSCP